MKKIVPLVLCGGSGSRLWPMSRTESPKQFQKVGGPDSLSFFQTTLNRHAGDIYEEPVICTSMLHRDLAVSQMDAINAQATIISEPMGRNTGPAVLASCRKIAESDPDAIVLVLPADHMIEGDMDSAIGAQIASAEAGHIITFGITPRYPETGFGYIADGGPVDGFPGLHSVERFIEKPPLEVAQELINTGRSFWASGISMFSAKVLIEEYENMYPQTALSVRLALEHGIENGRDILLEGEHFVKAESEPTEAAIFEKTKRIALAQLDVEWSDVGSWKAMYGISKADAKGNVLHGDVIAVDAENTMVHSDGRLISVVGLSDVIIIDTPDALLVTKASHSQNVKDVVEHLKSSKRPEVEKHAEKLALAAPDAPARKVADINSPGMADFLNSDKFNLGVKHINPDDTLTLEQGAGRQFIVVLGVVHASGNGWEKTVYEGGRIYSDPTAPVTIRNISGVVAELLFLSLDMQPDVEVTLPINSKSDT